MLCTRSLAQITNTNSNGKESMASKRMYGGMGGGDGWGSDAQTGMDSNLGATFNQSVQFELLSSFDWIYRCQRTQHEL